MRASAIKAFVVKDFKETFRDKVAVFWMIAWPLIWLVLTAYIFIPPGTDRPMTMRIGLVNYDASPGFPVNGSILIRALEEAEYKGVKLFNVKIYEDKALLLEDIKRGRIDAGIIIPENFGENLTLGQTTLEVYVGARSIQSTQINRYMLERFIEEFSRVVSEEKIAWAMKFIPGEYVPLEVLEVVEGFLRGLAKPVNATFTEVLPEALISREAWIGWYTIGAIGMTMLYSGLNIGSTALLEERQRGCLHKILASPTTPSELIFGKILSGILSLNHIGSYNCFWRICLWGKNPLESASRRALDSANNALGSGLINPWDGVYTIINGEERRGRLKPKHISRLNAGFSDGHMVPKGVVSSVDAHISRL
ncbi:MAG: ABC transporter permease [Candidatus Bathyarchaeia archaeon]